MLKKFIYLSAICATIVSCQKDIETEATQTESALAELVACGRPQLPPGECGQLRTQTPGGWGAAPHGNNPGTYLHANFAKAFPNGLTIGCSGGGTLTVTSAQAITRLLPTGGRAAAISGQITNPAFIKNVLVGHLIALSLSRGFDTYDENFGSSTTQLSNMLIASGPFAGMTVGAFIDIANNVIGGCSNSYSIQQILNTAAAINESNVDGRTTSSILTCPDGGPR